MLLSSSIAVEVCSKLRVELQICGGIFPVIERTQYSSALIPNIPVYILSHEKPHRPFPSVRLTFATDSIDKQFHSFCGVTLLAA